MVLQGSRGCGEAGVAALTSWSSFTRSCSWIRTVYSSSHLTDMGKGERTDLESLLSPHTPPPQAQIRPQV